MSNATSGSTKPTELGDEADLDAFLTEHDLALVEFYTEGCGICASMEPVVGLTAKATDVSVALINPRDDPPLVDRFSVRRVPLFVLFRNGKPVTRRADGFVGVEELISWVEANQ